MVVEDRGSLGLAQLQQAAQEMVQLARSQGSLQGVVGTFSNNSPQLYLDINRTKAESLQVPLSGVFETLQLSEAAIEATRCRFRPIVMTSFTFIVGVLPLLIATGAGAASQRAIGTVVFGGMISSTLLAIPFVPVFFVMLEGLNERWRGFRVRR
jgi:multidrug efflux pump subunit AcrB